MSIAPYPERKLLFTLPQVAFTRAIQEIISLEWGRGGGKSTVIAWRIKDIVNNMPRAKGGIVGSTYTQLLSRTLPSTVEGLELLGFKKDTHYVVGRRPPKEWKWPEAYQPPLSYENTMIFYNGTTFQFISLDNSDSGRGLNLDFVIGDEAALFNEDKLAYNVLLSNRGNEKRFKHTWLHHSVLFTSTTPTSISGEGKWFIRQEEAARREPKKILHMIADTRYNLQNVGAKYLRNLERKLTAAMYNTEVMCIRPTKADTGFYPAFDIRHHGYQSSNDNHIFGLKYDMQRLKQHNSLFDADINRNQAIDIAFDYGSKINTLVCGQLHGREYRIPKAMHIKTPELLPALVDQFCEYFSNHNKKEVNYYYDHTAIGRDALRTTTYAEEIIKRLEHHGWTVIPYDCGMAPHHDTKYQFFQILYSEAEPNLPQVRINKYNCQSLVVSIEQAGAYDGPKGTQKDKRPERRESAVDEETTHYSDAHDTLLFFQFRDGLGSTGYIVQAVA